MNQDAQQCFRLFKLTLPEILRGDDAVKGILGDADNQFLFHKDGDRVVGCSVINQNCIYLLCVDAACQRRGIGASLLARSEEHILSKGYTKAVVGAGRDYIMPGVPMNRGAHQLFIRRGYTHAWGDCGCFDMCQWLKDFDWTEHAVGDTIDGITYRWATLDDLPQIRVCVTDADADFVTYYDDPALYQRGASPCVLIAQQNGEVLGALLVSMEAEGKGVGSVGCTATATRHRGRGIATNMVRLGTRHLKDMGMTKAALGYTYTDILKLYGRAGYRVSMEYFMAEKQLKG